MTGLPRESMDNDGVMDRFPNLPPGCCPQGPGGFL